MDVRVAVRAKVSQHEKNIKMISFILFRNLLPRPVPNKPYGLYGR